MAGTLLLICSICRQFVNDQQGDPRLTRWRAKVSFFIPLICAFSTVHLAILFGRLYCRSLPPQIGVTLLCHRGTTETMATGRSCHALCALCMPRFQDRNTSGSQSQAPVL